MAENICALTLYTYKDISDVVYAKKLISICKDIGLQWEKIGMYEPLRTPYTDDLFYQYWLSSKWTGRNAESLTEYANVFCAQDRGSIKLMAGWKTSTPPKYSTIDFIMTRKAFCMRMPQFEKLFFRLIDMLEPDYAAVYNWRFRLNIRGTYLQKVPLHQDIHWITYISNERMQEMKRSINELSWYKCINLPQGAVCYMCDYIPKDGDPIETKCLEYRSQLWGVKV